MNSFEEKFPSLSVKPIILFDDGDVVSQLVVPKGDVVEYCLDKQKVREALSKVLLMRRDEDYMQFQKRIKEGIMKELGL